MQCFKVNATLAPSGLVNVASPQPSAVPKTARPEPSLTARESYTAELSLLQRAQAAYTDRNFATTLLLVSEHTRRFPNGRLAEEREALHVKALIGAGRVDEAHRAASAFATRFPRSALLPRVGHD
jgi:outer membrane protein assembly factor BamD (BamD/ComL family)